MFFETAPPDAERRACPIPGWCVPEPDTPLWTGAHGRGARSLWGELRERKVVRGLARQFAEAHWYTFRNRFESDDQGMLAVQFEVLKKSVRT